MASSVDTPILIGSDDESDSDVEILREEKNEDLDVIFISETAPTVQTSVKREVVKSVQSSLPDSTQGQNDAANKTVQDSNSSFLRNLSVSSNLRLSLNLNERDSTSPLDLSSKRSSDLDLSDSQDSESGSSCDSSDIDDFLDVSPSPLVSPLPSKQSVDYSTDIPLKPRAHSSTDAFQLDSSPSFRDACANGNITIDCSPKCLDSHPGPDDACWTSVDASSNSNLDCGNPSLSLSASDDPQMLNSSSFATSSSDVGLITAPPSDVGIITAPTTDMGIITAPVGHSSLSSQKDSLLQHECSAPKKMRESTSNTNPFDSDIWDSLKQDLDFLNKASSGFSDVTTSTSQSNSKTSVCGIDTSYPLFPNSQDNLTPSGLTKHLHNQTPAINSSTGIASLSNPASDMTLGRSLSFNNPNINISKQLPPKKQIRYLKQTSEPAIKNSLSESSSSNTWGSEKCAKCSIALGSRTSRCLQGHATCGLCMEENVKLVLTGKSKETLRCVHGGCDSYYPLSELKQSLPSMVVEILEDKLDNDYIDFIANLIMKNASSPPTVTTNKKSESEDIADLKDSAPEEESPEMSDDEIFQRRSSTCSEEEQYKIPSDWPLHWTYMDQRMGYKLCELEPESEEYIDVAMSFYASLAFPTADILKISRVQNPILWKYFSVKKTEMIQENDGLNVEEKHLFHGTSSSVVEAICKKGFDWRVCGKHGTVYGQGSYFAVNSSYSHQYTDKGNARRGRIASMMRTSMPFGMIAPPPYINTYVGKDLVRYNLHPSSTFGMPQLGSSSQPSPAHSGPCPAHSGQPSHVVVPFRHTSGSSSTPGGTTSQLQQQQQQIQSQSSGPQPTTPTSQLAQPSVNTQMPSSPSSIPNVPSFSLSQRRDYPSATSSACLTQSSSSSLSNSSSSSGTYNQLGMTRLMHRLNMQRKQQMSQSSFRPIGSQSSISSSSNLGPKSNSGTDTKSDTGLSSPAASATQQMSSFVHRMGLQSRDPLTNNVYNRFVKYARKRMSVRFAEEQEDQGEKTVHKVFMAKVLVGRYTGGNANMRKPPPLDQVNEPYGKCYDSCVDDIHNPKIFVIFDSTQAYPDYLIEYHCTL